MDEHGWRHCDAYNFQTANEDIFGRSSHINAGCEFPTLVHGCDRRKYFGHVWSRYSTYQYLQRCCPWSNLRRVELWHMVSAVSCLQYMQLLMTVTHPQQKVSCDMLSHYLSLLDMIRHDRWCCSWSWFLELVFQDISSLFFCAGLKCCTVSRVNITPYHHPILVLPSIRQANLDAPHRIGEFLWGMLYCRHPSWVQVLFSTFPWKKHVASRQSCEFSLFASCQCAWLNKRLKKLLSELIAKRACSNIFHMRRQVKTVEDGTAGLSRCVHPGLRGHLVLCTCSWSRAFTKGDPGQKNERDSWYLTRGKFLCLTLAFWNLALRGIPPSPWNFLILLTLLGVTMATMVYRYDDTTQDSTVQPVELSGQTILAGECKVPWCSRLKGC